MCVSKRKSKLKSNIIYKFAKMRKKFQSRQKNITKATHRGNFMVLKHINWEGETENKLIDYLMIKHFSISGIEQLHHNIYFLYCFFG